MNEAIAGGTADPGVARTAHVNHREAKYDPNSESKPVASIPMTSPRTLSWSVAEFAVQWVVVSTLGGASTPPLRGGRAAERVAVQAGHAQNAAARRLRQCRNRRSVGGADQPELGNVIGPKEPRSSGTSHLRLSTSARA